MLSVIKKTLHKIIHYLTLTFFKNKIVFRISGKINYTFLRKIIFKYARKKIFDIRKSQEHKILAKNVYLKHGSRGRN